MAARPPSAQLTTAFCFTIQALGVGTYIAFGVFFNPLMEEFGWPRAAIAAAPAAAFFVMGVFGMAVGRLNDSFGPRLLLTATALLLGLGCALMARVSSLWGLYLSFGLVFGMGLSAVDVLALTTIARWFTARRGLMTGIVKAGTGAGQFAVPLAASALIALYGWRRAIGIVGLSVAAVLIGIAQFLHRDPGASAPSTGESPRRIAAETAAPGLPLARVFRASPFWVLCTMNLILVSCLMVVMLHIVPHARDLGIPPIPAAAVLSTIGGVSIAGRLASGALIDRLGSKTVMHLGFGLLLGGLLWLQFSDRPAMLYLFGAVYGLAHGTFFTAISPLAAEWFGIRFHGTVFGIVACFGTTGGAVGPILAGHLFDVTGSYRLAFLMMTALALAAWGMLFALRPVREDE
ncbi:MAG: MFS transporter [Desulfobacterales bacterium]